MQYIHKQPHLFQFLNFVQHKQDNICSHQTCSLGSRYTTKNAFSIRIWRQMHFGAHAENVSGGCKYRSSPLGKANSASTPSNSLAGFEGPVSSKREKEGKGKEGQGRKRQRKHPPK